MNGQNDLVSIQNPKSYQTTILAVLITALIVGGGVYAWQQSQLSSTEARLQEQITSLQNQIALSSKQTTKQDAALTKKEDANKETPDDPKDQQEQQDFIKLKEEGRHVYYSGTATISGTYQELFGNTSPLSDVLCFYPDESSKNLIPRKNDGTKAASFCFDNQDKAKVNFGINDNDISSKNIGCIEGKGTITISNYKVTKVEGESSDNATLEQVVSKETYKNSCSL